MPESCQDGNQAVLKNYNCTYLRTAARNITTFTTGKDAHQKQIVYGERALDVVFSFGGISGGKISENEFDKGDIGIFSSRGGNFCCRVM